MATGLRITLGFSRFVLVAPAPAATNDPWTIDFRYAPPVADRHWPARRLAEDARRQRGSLVYDYPGSYAGFGTRICSLSPAPMQAISGAGYPGVPSMDILGNVIPFIGNEEEKMEQETQKISAKSARRPISSRCPPRIERALQSRGLLWMATT